MKISLQNNDDLEIGITINGTLIGSLGDSICLSPIIEQLSKDNNQLITVSTLLPELFLKNPFVKRTICKNNPDIPLLPSTKYEYNIVDFYSKQMGMNIPNGTAPKIYLTPDEIEYGKNSLKEFDGYVKIAISLETNADCRNLRYEFIYPLLERLKFLGFKLIGIGSGKDKQYNYHKSFVNGTTIREAAAILSQCDLYLGIDAGLFHLAAAVNIPQIVFFRNNQSSNNRYTNTYFIDSNIECKGACLAGQLHSCKSIYRCMDNFDLNEYYKLIIEKLTMAKIYHFVDVNEIKRDFGLRAFVETGTADGLQFLDYTKYKFDDYYSCEINRHQYDIAIGNVGHIDNIHISNKSSNEFLNDLLPTIKDVPTIFWLDAHFPGCEVGIPLSSETNNNIRMPLEDEIRLISKLKNTKNDVIVCDDLRHYEDGDFGAGNWKDRKSIGGDNIDFIYECFKDTHNITKKYEYDGCIVITPKKLSCYVINFYLGDRRFDIDTYETDKLCYLRAQIDALEKYKHSLSKIIFNFNVEPNHYDRFNEALKIIPKRIQDTDVEVTIRRNFGLSYGAFSDIFKKNMDKYEYYIFNEDDYVIVQDDFDKYLVGKFNSLPNCGYLCGLVRNTSDFHQKHAGMSAGISSYNVLKKIFDLYGELPHAKNSEYNRNECYSQVEQSNAVIKLGYDIYDIREDFRMRMKSSERINGLSVTHIYFMWNDKDLFLPTNLYLNELNLWIDQISEQYIRMECDTKSTKYFKYGN